MTLVREYQPTFVLGDGETKEFSYLFEEVSENFIKVIVKHSDDSTYVPVFSVDLDSHKVVFGESETAPLDTDLVCIYRETPDLQDTPFRTLQGYDAKALENILSKIVAMIQELKANGFSTQILQGTPWQLDLLHPADDNASVVIDYNARILKKGLYFQIVSGNLQVSADGSSFITMPKSADITEFRCLETVLEDLTVVRKLQYKVSGVWYDAESNAQATADQALNLAQTVQGDLSSHKLDHNNPHETSLGNLTDTDFTNLQTNQFLKFDGTKWVNADSSAVASWGSITGTISNQTDLMTEFAKYVKTDGSSTMTNPLMMRATDDFKCAIAPYWDGIGFFKLNDNNSVTLMASIEYNSGFEPATTNTYNIGANSRKWKNLYLSGTAYVAKLNNGSDIDIPNLAGTMLVNRTTATNSISVGGGTSSVQAVQFGALGSAGSMATSYGFSTFASGTQAIAIGHGSQATASKSYAFGEQAISSAIGAFQFGQATNNEAGSVYFALTTDGNTTVNYKLLDSYGLIPGARLADTTSATQGQILTLNSSLIPQWTNAPSGLPDTTGATQGQVLTLDSNLDPEWADASGGTSNYHPDLFDWKWADHQLDDVQWLRADTFSWQSGSVYESAYQHLVDETYIAYIVDVGSPDKYYRMASDDVDGALHPYAWGDNGSVVYYTDSETPQVSDSLYYGANDSTATSAVDEYGLDVALTPQTETIAGTTITYYQATDGHKIVLADQESNVTAIYNATGVAWYYILDTTNERFKLPRSKHEHYGNRPVVGNGDTMAFIKTSDGTFPAYGQGIMEGYGANNGQLYVSTGGTIGLTEAPEKSGIISTPMQDTDQHKYLYFYVGEFTQTAIENTAGLNAELFNDKVDKGHQVIAFQAPTADNNYTWYRLYADGWVEQGGVSVGSSDANYTVSLPVAMSDTNYTVLVTVAALSTPNTSNVGANRLSAFNITTSSFDLRGDTSAALQRHCWQVSGMAAS